MVLGPPFAGNVVDGTHGVVWPQRQRFASNNSASVSNHQSPVNVQKLRQRRLTRMLLFISFAWLALTAPFTLHSFLPTPSSPASSDDSSSSSLSSLAVSNYSNSTLSVNDSLTYEMLLLHDRQYVSVFTSSVNSRQLQSTTTPSFFSEKHDVWPVSTPVTTSSPSTGIDPSRYLLIKIICFLLMYTNHAVNFYLYCLTGKRFRQELALMFNCDRVTVICGRSTDEMLVADVGGELAARCAPRDAPVHLHDHHSDRSQQNQAKSNSASSRTRSNRTMKRSEFDERYS